MMRLCHEAYKMLIADVFGTIAGMRRASPAGHADVEPLDSRPTNYLR